MEHIIYSLALVAHVAGITIMAGTTFMDYITFKQFWKLYRTDEVRGIVVENILYKLQRFLGIGMAVILSSGVLMMAYLHQVWGEQIWFRIKMVILLLIIINGLGVRRSLGNKLRKLLAQGPSFKGFEKKLSGIRTNFSVVYALQMMFFLIIFVLSVFKFN